MSIKIKEWLDRLDIVTTHEDRVEIDRQVEAKTGMFCDEGIRKLSEAEFLAIVREVKNKPRKKLIAEMAA